MFAIFGNISFAVLGSPQRMESRFGYEYASHPVLEDRPRLQWVGDAPQVVTLELMFHASFTNPSAQLAALEQAAAEHQAQALVFGSGEFRGYFVVSSLAVTSQQLGADGKPIAIQARLVLTEWNSEGAFHPGAPPIPLFTPIAVAQSGSLVSAAAAAARAGIPALPGISAMLNNPSSTGAA